MEYIKIVIVEDDAELREFMQLVFKHISDIHCTGAYESAELFLRDLDRINADVILMDITLHGMNGIQCVREAKPKRPDLQYLMCTSHNDAERTFDALRAGATGYILKTSSSDDICQAIRDIQKGGSPMSPEIARLVVATFNQQYQPADLLSRFTTREQEILHDLAKGYSYQEIADKNFISIETVRTYLRKIYTSLQVHSKVEALNKVFPRG
jgi:DNA-binding NarL/FixJ family response regulator